MPLTLKSVAPRRGAQWVRDGLALFGRAPLAFSALMAVYTLATLFFLVVLPWPLRVLALSTVPLMVLGFMLASQSALTGGPVSPRQFVEPMVGDKRRRKALLLLCACSLVAVLGLLFVYEGTVSEPLARISAAMSKQDPAALAKALDDAGLREGLLLLTVAMLVLSIPFWHAPALVHWGGQTALQAMFSSTLAVWRNKGALAVYALVWTVVQMAVSLVLTVLASLIGSPAVAVMLAFPLSIALTAAMAVSMLFTFNDSFGNAQAGGG